MSIFKHLREKKSWSVYQAAKELGLSYSEYVRLEEGTRGERFVDYMYQMQKLTGATTGEIKKLLKQTKATSKKS